MAKCKECIHVDVCEMNPFIPAFSPENEAYCRAFKSREDFVQVKHGWWKGYTHSALVRWKDGEPVWEDRNVYRCGRCDFGTIAKHNYCPRCGAKMDLEVKDA